MPEQVQHALAHLPIQRLPMQIQHTADAAHGQRSPETRPVAVDRRAYLLRRSGPLTDAGPLSWKLPRNPTATLRPPDALSDTWNLLGSDSCMLARYTAIRYTMGAPAGGHQSGSGAPESQHRSGVAEKGGQYRTRFFRSEDSRHPHTYESKHQAGAVATRVARLGRVHADDVGGN